MINNFSNYLVKTVNGVLNVKGSHLKKLIESGSAINWRAI